MKMGAEQSSSAIRPTLVRETIATLESQVREFTILRQLVQTELRHQRQLLKAVEGSSAPQQWWNNLRLVDAIHVLLRAEARPMSSAEIAEALPKRGYNGLVDAVDPVDLVGNTIRNVKSEFHWDPKTRTWTPK